MEKTFQERLQKKTNTKSFIGREAELELFKNLLEQDEPEYLILLVHGIGGVGKTWLLNQWYSSTRKKGFLAARVSEEQTSVEQILKKFRDDLIKQGFEFDEFDKSYHKFRQLKLEAEKTLSQWEENNEKGVAQMAGRVTGKSIAVIAKLFTPSNEALEFMGGSKKVEQIFAEGFGYLRKKFKDKEDLAFLETPLLLLTRNFVKDLNRICEKKRVVLFLDTYEYLAPFIDEWFCRIFLLEELSDQIMFVFAGRDTFSPRWLDYQPLARQIPLDVFTNEEAQAYLTARGVVDPHAIEEILKISGKLPVYLAMLTTQTTKSVHDTEFPTATVVERFLQWIPKGESDKRRAVVYCTFPRFFNRDILQVLINTTSTEIAQTLFDWLLGQPFISHPQQRWVYHGLVRDQILHYKWQESAQESREVHGKALTYYRQHPGNGTILEELYHLLSMDTEQGIALGLSGIFQAWVEGESWEDWIVKADEVVRQVEKEHDGKNRCVSIWEKHLRYIFQQTPKLEGLLTQLGKNETLNFSGRTGAYVHLGNLLFEQKRFDEAEQTYAKAIELKPDYATAYGNLGNLLSDQKRFDEAEQAYAKVIELNPDDATAYGNLGTLLSNQKRFDEAELAYAKAIELNPDYATAYGNLGTLLSYQKRFDEAEQAYAKAIKLNPDDATVYVNLGNLRSDQKRFDEAEQAYAKAIKLNPDDATTYYNLGTTLSYQKRFDEAEQAYAKAIELKPDYATAYGNLGTLLFYQKRFDEAEQAYAKAIELNPNDAKVYGNLGWIFYIMGDWDKSIHASNEALSIDCTQAWIQFNLALAIVCRGNTEKAKKEYQKGRRMANSESLNAAITDLQEALKKNPNLTGIREILVELERQG